MYERWRNSISHYLEFMIAYKRKCEIQGRQINKKIISIKKSLETGILQDSRVFFFRPIGFLCVDHYYCKILLYKGVHVCFPSLKQFTIWEFYYYYYY
jgi:hypothetical protein